jgi:hypothetical protein
MSFSSLVNRNDYTGNGAVSSYSYTYKIFAETHLLVTVATAAGVETELTLTTDYTVSGVGASGGGAITLVSAGQAWLTGGNLTSGYKITIRRVVPHTQVVDIRNQGSFYPEVHEDEFDKLVMADQQQQDEIDRSARMPETISASVFDPTFPAGLVGVGGITVITNPAGSGFVVGPTADAISDAQAEAIAAAASAAAALVSENAASASEAAAAASEAAAAATLASAFFRDVIYITHTSSPLTITQADNGKLYSCNSSGGAISVTLPEISTLTTPFNICFKLETAGNNLTINRSGTDTIDGSTSKVISIADTGAQLIADTGATPDDWTNIDLNVVGDGTITTAKLNSQVVNGASTVTAALADSVLIADASDSGNVKKALISDIVNDSVRSVTTTDTVLTTDRVNILSGASFTSTLFAGSGNTGKRITFVHSGVSVSQVYTISRAGSDVIGEDDATSISLVYEGDTATLEWDGSKWQILGKREAKDYKCRAWVRFDGTTNNDLSGTYSRTGTTVTVTATDHGHLVGHLVYCDFTTGSATDGVFTILTVPDANTFTFTHGASGSTSGNVTLLRKTIVASANVQTVVQTQSTGGQYAINFATLFADANYAAIGQIRSMATTATYVAEIDFNDTPTTAYCKVWSALVNTTNNHTFLNSDITCWSFFR